jgi:hypothetical protein
MKKIFYLYRYINFLLNKYNYYQDREDVMDAIHNASMTLFMQRYGNPQEYQPGRPLPRVGYQLTQKVTDDLRGFLRELTYAPDPAVGEEFITGSQIQFPQDMAHPTSLTWKDADYTSPVIQVDDDKVAEKLRCPITGPTAEFPVAEVLSDGVRVYPQPTGKLTLKYLAYPVRPHYATTLVGGEEVYDDANSIDIGWPETTFRQIAMIALGDFGINLKDQQVQQYSEYRKREGV